MTLGYVQSAQGHGWETMIGDRPYWFGRGRSGRLFGGFASVMDLLDAFDAEEATTATGGRFDPAVDKRMVAERDADGLYVLKIAGEVVGYCTDDRPLIAQVVST